MHNSHFRGGFLVWAALGCLLVFSTLLSGCVMVDVADDALTYIGNSVPESGDSYGKRVCVVPFGSGVKKLAPLAQDLSGNLASVLEKSSRYNQIDFSELSLEMQGASNQAGARDILMQAGRKLGLNAVVTGSVTDLSIHYRFDGLIYGLRENTPFLRLEAQMRVTDPVTGVVVSERNFMEETEINDMSAENIRLGSDPEPEIVAQLLANIKDDSLDWFADALDDLRWGGVVLEVRESQALITVGRDTGFSNGATLEVIAAGEMLKSGSGQEIYVPGPKLAKLNLVEIGERNSWAKITMYNLAEEAEEAKADDKDAKADQKKPEPPQVTPGLIVRPK